MLPSLGPFLTNTAPSNSLILDLPPPHPASSSNSLTLTRPVLPATAPATPPATSSSRNSPRSSYISWSPSVLARGSLTSGRLLKKKFVGPEGDADESSEVVFGWALRLGGSGGGGGRAGCGFGCGCAGYGYGYGGSSYGVCWAEK
ncbi:hypothetical protein DSL72_009516 [Monilinia vaccinii-corymbosi]|uniref:Uncharacterized protein n=1 Tax=Monilinia vaccinii-corymbosi TaxID=61207 RepID=A0A8A3PPP9_9HELO|nr:hypothetical protein DSL72_009516 [Monilinia vaccinii-corymbosi]